MTAPIRRLPAAPVAAGHAAGVVVVGTGAAGMSAALAAAAAGADVLVVSKGQLGGGSTPWAQGGLAAVSGPDDSAALHARDTEVAGAGLCDDAAVATLVGAAPGEVHRLSALGARWDAGPPGLEGGHSRRRIVHAGGDASGAEVHRVLAGAFAAAVADGRIRLWQDAIALDAVVDGGSVTGVLVGRDDGGGALSVVAVSTRALVLATGGFGHAFATTTNPDGVTGDGLAVAARAGAEICDVEFVQFHPTVLWLPGGRGRRPLLTEALRGAGAVIVDAGGRGIMAGAHPLADLAPRDVVSAVMHRAMGERSTDHLFLDARRVPGVAEEFPTVAGACRSAGYDLAAEPVPIAPGAHYACGGVRADLDGTTSVDGLFAVGEVAATGVHGANRLASNSLTESLVAGRRVGARLAGRRAPGALRGGPPEPGAGVDPTQREALADAMSRHCGVVRNGEALEHVLEVHGEARSAGGALDRDVVEATNLHTVSTLVATGALLRTESRGCHRRSEFPEASDSWRRHITLSVDGDQVAAAVAVDA